MDNSHWSLLHRNFVCSCFSVAHNAGPWTHYTDLYRFITGDCNGLPWIAGESIWIWRKLLRTGPGTSSWPPRTMSRWMEGGRRPQGPQGQPGTGRRNCHRIVTLIAYIIHMNMLHYVTYYVQNFINYLHVMTCYVSMFTLRDCLICFQTSFEGQAPHPLDTTFELSAIRFGNCNMT